MSPDWPLETSRLTLRPFVESDFDAVYAMRSDPAVVLYLYQGPLSPDETWNRLERNMALSAWTAEGDWLSVAAVERTTGLTVGDTALHWVSERDRTAEIGFVLAPERQGNGFATEAAAALVEWAFGSAR